MSQPLSFNVTTEEFDKHVIEASYQQPVLVDFWASWCNPCKILMPLLEQLCESYQGKFKLAKVETDQQRELTTRYEIRSIPTVLLIKNGEIVEQFSSVLPETDIRTLLDNQLPCPADEYLEKASEAYQNNQPELAKQQLELALSSANESPRVIAAACMLLMEKGEFVIAAKHLQHLPIRIETHQQIAPLRARLSFVPLLDSKHSLEQLQHQLASDNNNPALLLQIAAHQVLAGELEAAMESLLTIIKLDAKFQEGIARKQMLKIFEALGNSGELVHKYRLQMAKYLL